MLKIAIFEDDSVHTLILKDKLKASVQIPCELTVFASMEDFKASFAEENSYDIVFMDIELEHEKPMPSISFLLTPRLFLSVSIWSMSPASMKRSIFISLIKNRWILICPKLWMQPLKNWPC